MAINEDAISQALDRACNNPSLYFQVTAQEPYLSILINREAESELDYNTLAKTIQETITLFSLPAEIQYLALYSRVYGVSNTDWETSIELERQVEASLPLAPTPEEPKEAIESPTVEAVGQAVSLSHKETLSSLDKETLSSLDKETPSSLDKETLSSLDLSQYCFIRNHSLLTASIIPPPAEVARVVLFFHNLPDSEKEQVLPALEPALKKAKVQEDNNFSSEVNQWLEEIAGFNPEQSRKASIWFSRYCNNLEGTISELTAVLEPPAPEPESPASEPNPPSLPQQEETSNLEKPVNRVAPSYSTSGEPTPRTRPKGRKKRAAQPKWLPIAAIVVVLAILTVVTISVFPVFQTPKVAKVAALCQDSPSQSYCQLAIDIVGGEESLRNTANTSLPFDSDGKEEAISECKSASDLLPAALLWGFFNSEVNSSQEVLPGIYVTDLQLRFPREPEAEVRVACIMQNSDRDRDPTLVAMDTIPKNWPEEPYQNKEELAEETSETWKILNGVAIIEKLGNLGVSISFVIDVGCSAIALYLVSMVGWIGIGVNSLKTLGTVAAIWGTFETIISIIFGSLPPLRILVIFSMLVRLIAFWIISLLVKGLKLDLTGGYPTFLFSVGCFQTIRVLLKMAIFYLIFILFFS